MAVHVSRFVVTFLCVACLFAACSSDQGGRLESADPTTTGGDVSVAADAGDAAFCAKVVDVFGRYRDAFENPTGGPTSEGVDPQAALAQVKQMGLRLAPPMRELADAAPAGVATALDQLAGGFESMGSGDIASLAGTSTQMGEAGQQFGDYLATHCQDVDIGGLGAVTGAFGATGTQPPPAPTGVDDGTDGAGPTSAPPTSASGDRGPYAPPRPGR